MNWIDQLLAADLVPDAIIRIGIRNLLRRRLAESRADPDPGRLVAGLKQGPIAVCAADANTQHYEVPAEFFTWVLGRRLKYSSGYWPAGVTTLDDSEEAMLNLSCDRARVEDGHRVLDLGCGWGSLSLWLAERFRRCRITALSNSRTQKEFIDSEIRRRGLSNLTVLTADINTFDPGETFDRIVSIEMFEHMRNHEKLMGKIARWLDRSGLLFVHVFSHRTYAYLFEDRGPSDWMSRYFFTGGIMPSDDWIPQFQKDLRLIDRWRMSGEHYSRTAESWLSNMDRRRPEILELFSGVYGAGPEALRWWVYWRVFFMSCAELWGFRGGGEWGVSHYLFERRP